MDNKYVINISVPIDRNDMISEIKLLKRNIPVINQTKYREYIPEQTIPKKIITKPTVTDIIYKPDPIIESEDFKEPEKDIDEIPPQQMLFSTFDKKKKKKKRGKLSSLMLSSGENNFSQDDDIDKNDDLSNLIDMDALIRRDDDNDEIENNIIDEQRTGYDKLKKQDNPYKKEFAEESTLLYALLNEVNLFSKDLEKKYRTMEDAKVRGIGKYMTDLAQAVLASKQTKLSVLREISNVKKIVTDFKFKVDAKTKEAESGGNSNDRLASSYLSKLIAHGRGNFIKDYGNTGEDEGLNPHEALGSFNSNNFIDTEEDNDKYDRLIKSRLESAITPFRSDAGNKYIEYENRGVKIYIKKCVDTGEWEFIALDKDKQQIYDYPVPRKRDVGKVKFSPDGNYATDFAGRTYNVIEWFSPVYND